MREDQQHWKTVCFSSAHLFCLPMTSVLSDRLCFLRMPAILPVFPTCPCQPVQLCITLETGAKLFSGNFSAAFSDAKKQVLAKWWKSASAPVYMDKMGTRSLVRGHNGTTRWKCHQSTSSRGALSESGDLITGPEKSPQHS